MTYNIYQTKLWRDINEKVYKKPSFVIKLFEKEYFGLIKTKRIGPFKLNWYQIMGVELPDNEEFVLHELDKIRKKYSKNKRNILFQLGFINEIIRFENVGRRSDDFKSDMRSIRLNIRELINTKFNLNVSFRENMPQSNIVYDVTKKDEQLLAEMNSGCKERVKKAIKKGIYFGIASPDWYDIFYNKWLETVGNKGVNIIPRKDYYKLIRYLTQNNRGNLFISQIDGEIVAGSICLYDQHRIIYLYGFANRKFGNIGGHHYLKFKIFGWARDNGFTYCDMLGGAPTGFPDHPLTSVSNFKESLGGMKIERYGSYDLILNGFLSKIFKLYTRYRGK
ncbi:peptidoglycan bridge formation glycyltransferase FemA/FemB family protein [Candidatus Gracilibacteria bacterium]|nr:peptidoglycan bridge formation glycyltransferase FemA/FemB family protein [Candidatus Gracilibacteria bacterium]